MLVILVPSHVMMVMNKLVVSSGHVRLMKIGVVQRACAHKVCHYVGVPSPHMYNCPHYLCQDVHIIFGFTGVIKIMCYTYRIVWTIFKHGAIILYVLEHAFE